MRELRGGVAWAGQATGVKLFGGELRLEGTLGGTGGQTLWLERRAGRLEGQLGAGLRLGGQLSPQNVQVRFSGAGGVQNAMLRCQGADWVGRLGSGPGALDLRLHCTGRFLSARAPELEVALEGSTPSELSAAVVLLMLHTLGAG